MADVGEAAAVDALLGRVEALAARRWRGLLWLKGPAGSCRRRALALWRAGGWRSPLWVAPGPPAEDRGIAWLPPGKARGRLGGEHDLLVIDAVSRGAGFDPDAFGALSGTLSAGGVLILLTPADWGTRPDADYARLAPHPWRPEALTARYLSRLSARLAASPGVIHWPTGDEPRPPEPAAVSPSTAASADPDCLTAGQAEAVSRLVRLRRRRPLVLTADRGRGKSAALGIACARLLAAGEEQILVTAPRPAAVEALFERLAALCPEGRREGHAFRLDAGRPEERGVHFVAPDALTERVRDGNAGGAGRLLLVDEAAGLPAALLDAWLVAFPRIAFATTVHGYEGGGRGFALRFRERLERRTPGWRAWHLDEPIRWAADDPLEPLVADLLLLDATPGPAAPAGGELVPREWDRDALVRDEPTLRALHGLLVQAHYRTTPADLRRLLDAPAGRVAGLAAPQGPQAVVVTDDEGGFDAELAERVARGERRPRGHLLAQSLAAHAGARGALQARLRRVVRIAVHPGRRREGLGRGLIDAERERARHDGLTLLGASFGAEPGLIAFWQSLGFRAVRLGLTRETATGEHALMVVAPLNPEGEALADALGARFRRQLPGLLAFELADLEPRVALALLAEDETPVLDAEACRDLADVALGHRAPALARPALQALVRVALAAGRRDAELEVLAAWAFLGHDLSRLARTLGLAGRRQAEARLRECVATLRTDLDRGFPAPGAEG